MLLQCHGMGCGFVSKPTDTVIHRGKGSYYEPRFENLRQFGIGNYSNFNGDYGYAGDYCFQCFCISDVLKRGENCLTYTNNMSTKNGRRNNASLENAKI